MSKNTKKKMIPFTVATLAMTAFVFAVVTACTNEQAKAKPNYVFKETAPKPGVLAKVNGEEITEEALIDRTLWKSQTPCASPGRRPSLRRSLALPRSPRCASLLLT